MKRQPSFAACYLIIIGLTIVLVGVASIHAATPSEQANVAINIAINYGTGPIEWHNNTAIPRGENLLNATMRVATVKFSSYPGLGAFITGINGVNQNSAANLYWTFWVYNSQSREYELPPVGASAYVLASDQTVQWYYSSSILGPGTSVSLSVRLDTSTDPPTAVILGSIHPIPSAPVNVTLEYSQNQGANYQQIARITTAADGTYSYSWKLPSGGVFMIMADAQGAKSPPASIATSSGVPGFPLESLFVGVALGLLFLIMRRRQRFLSRI